MRTHHCSIFRIAFLAAVAWHGGTVLAQAPAQVPARGREILRIRDISGLTRRDRLRTPEFRSNYSSAVNPAREWVRVMTEYETAPSDEWIDELTFQYHVMTELRQGNQREFSLFRTTVRYGDVERGRASRTHRSAVYLRPPAVERFGEPVAVAVEINLGGETIATASKSNIRELPEDWWRNPRVIESQSVKTRDGYLLDRSRTPFALVQIDDYEFIK